MHRPETNVVTKDFPLRVFFHLKHFDKEFIATQWENPQTRFRYVFGSFASLQVIAILLKLNQWITETKKIKKHKIALCAFNLCIIPLLPLGIKIRACVKRNVHLVTFWPSECDQCCTLPCSRSQFTGSHRGSEEQRAKEYPGYDCLRFWPGPNIKISETLFPVIAFRLLSTLNLVISSGDVGNTNPPSCINLQIKTTFRMNNIVLSLPPCSTDK